MDLDALVMRVGGIVFAVALSASACTSVTTEYPFGENAVEVDPEQWDGTWLSSDGQVFWLEVSDGTNGVLTGGGVENVEERRIFQESKIYVREVEGWVFASLPVTGGEPSNPTEYDWARIENDGELLVLWLPDVAKFRALVEKGVLPGHTRGVGVALGQLSSTHYSLIASEKEGVLFDWEYPYFYRRVAK